MKGARTYLWIVVVALVVWWFLASEPGREARELEIDDDVYSPTFGQPIDHTVPVDTGMTFGPPAPTSAAVADAIRTSSEAIAGYDVPPNPWGIESGSGVSGENDYYQEGDSE